MPREDGQIRDSVDGTEPTIRKNDRTHDSAAALAKTATATTTMTATTTTTTATTTTATTTTTRGCLPQDSVAVPRRDDNTRESRDRQTRKERPLERWNVLGTAVRRQKSAVKSTNGRQCDGRKSGAAGTASGRATRSAAALRKREAPFDRRKLFDLSYWSRMINDSLIEELEFENNNVVPGNDRLQ